MLSGSSILAFVLGLGMMFTLLYFSMAYSDPLIPTSAKLSQDDAISIVENDFKSRQSDYDRITGIIVNNTSGYVSFADFKDKNLKLPLVYVHHNGTHFRITGNSYENLGQCDDGLSAYCAHLPPYNFDYKGRLVYGVEVLLWHSDVRGEARGVPFLYIVDAMSGEIVDSTFLRSESREV